MVVPCGKHRGIERSELLRQFPSYALWAHRTVDWLTLTPDEEYSCKAACVARIGVPVANWRPGYNYDEWPQRRAHRRWLYNRPRAFRSYVSPDDEDYADDDLYNFGGPW